MRKILSILISIALIMCLVACKKAPKELRNFDIGGPLLLNDSEVSEVKFKNVPKTPIEIGYFSNQKIYLEVSFVDGSKENIHVTEDFFPKDCIKEFKIPGEKYFDCLFKGQHIPLKFSLKENVNPIAFKVEFYNEKNETIQTSYVSYLSSVSCTSVGKVKNYELDGYYYKYNGNLEKGIDYVYKNMDVHPTYDKFLLRNSYDNYNNTLSYDMVSHYNVGNEQHMLFYVGRYNDFIIQSMDTIERNEYKKEVISFDKRANAKSPITFVDNIAFNLKNDVLRNSYIHDSSKMYYDYYTIYQSSKLDFNLNISSELDIDGVKTEIPSCIMNSISNSGYTDFSGFARRDGINTSTLSLFDNNADLYFNYYLKDGETYDVTLAPDAKLGYYKVDYIADCDIYIDLTYTIEEGSGWYFITINNAKIGLDYDINTLKFDLRYSSTNEFTSYSKPVTINDKKIGESLVYYHS